MELYRFISLTEGKFAPTGQDWCLHQEDGEGGRGQGQDVPRHHRGLPHLLGAALPRHSLQLELGVGGRQEVDGSRGGSCIIPSNLLWSEEVSTKSVQICSRGVSCIA